MDKEKMKKVLKGIGVVGLVASVGLLYSGCGKKTEGEKEAVGDQPQMEAQASCGQGAEADTTAEGSCGQGSCGQGSCSQ
jgi:hypothetical protein